MGTRVIHRRSTAMVASLTMLLLAALLLLWPAPAHAQEADDDFVEGEVVVKLDPRTNATIGQVNRDYGTVTKEVLLENCATCAKIYLLEITDGTSTEAKAEQMEEDPRRRIAYAEPNFITEAPEGDPRHKAFSGSTPTPSADPAPYSSQYAIDALNLPAAHEISRGRSAVVAVLDTGVDLDHPELQGSLTAARYNFVDDNRVPADRPDGVDNDADGEVDEQTGHGTHVAGIVHLTAPEARIMPLRVLDSDGTGNVFLIAEAIAFAVRNDADVMNLSLGSRRESDLLEDIFEDLVPDDDDDDENEAEVLENVPPEGVVVVGAAGNGNSSTPQYPAAEEGAIAVASVDDQEKKSEFSNYDVRSDDKWIDISAPGEEIYSTFPTGQYASWAGTSMATPFVAGQAALIRSVNPTLKPEADDNRPSVENFIKSTARSLDAKNPDYAGLLGAGHADIGASLHKANPPPTITAMSPKPGTTIKNRRPAIRATVRDRPTNLAKSNIRLFVDGKRKTRFAYNRGTDRLTFRSPRLSYKRHTVRVVATDAHGKKTVGTWRFRVVR